MNELTLTRDNLHYPNILVRLLSLAIDLTIIYLTTALGGLLYALLYVMYDGFLWIGFVFEGRFWQFLNLVILFFYMLVGLASRFQSTIGMRVCCISLGNVSPGKRLSFIQITARTILFIVFLALWGWQPLGDNNYIFDMYIIFGTKITVFVSVLISIIRADKAGIHDLLCNTRVLQGQCNAEQKGHNVQYTTYYFPVLAIIGVWGSLVPLVGSSDSSVVFISVMFFVIICISLALLYLKKSNPSVYLEYSWNTAFKENKLLIKSFMPPILLYMIIYLIIIWVKIFY